MFKPISSIDGSSGDSCIEILELTTDSFAAASTPFPSTPSPTTPASAHRKEREKSLIITPQTRIFTLAEKYRIVFLIDLSASMSVVGGTGKPKVSINVAYETYRNSFLISVSANVLIPCREYFLLSVHFVMLLTMSLLLSNS